MFIRRYNCSKLSYYALKKYNKEGTLALALEDFQFYVLSLEETTFSTDMLR